MTGGGGAFVRPALPHYPGRTPRPPECAFAALTEGLSPSLSPAALAQSQAFRQGMTLFGDGFYWETHELFEAVWSCLPPASAERLFLRGLIQLANAGLKHRMGRPAAATRIMALADAALAEAGRRAPFPLMGLTEAATGDMRRQVLGESVSI